MYHNYQVNSHSVQLIMPKRHWHNQLCRIRLKLLRQSKFYVANIIHSEDNQKI